MPLYTYRSECGESQEELRGVAARHDPVACPKCGDNMKLEICAVSIDNMAMGVSPSFPTAWAKWGKMQTAKNRGKMKDANNDQKQY